MANNTTLAVNLTAPLHSEENLFGDILGVWITGVMCLLGLAGNALSFIVLLQAFRRSTMFFVLRAVAVSDGVFLMCVFVVQTVANLGLLDGYRARVQYYVWPIMMTTQMTTVWLTVLVSLERYVAICFPLKSASICTMSKARRSVATILVFCVVYNIPRYLEFTVVESHLERTELGGNLFYRYIYSCALYVLCLYFVPLLALAGLNLKLVHALKQGKKRWQSLQVRQKKEQNMTVIPLTIVLVFFLCASPALTVNVIDSIMPTALNQPIFLNLMLIGNFLVVLNSASNFVIYCLLGKKFRTKLLELCRCSHRGHRRQGCQRGRYKSVKHLMPQTQVSDF